MACQDYFTHFEPSQSLGRVKKGDPRENPPTTWLVSHETQIHSSEMMSDLER